MRPRIAFNRSCISKKRREERARTPKACRESRVSSLFRLLYIFFFENFAARIPEKDIRGRRLRHKTGLRRFWRWFSRESAWPISKLILAMGGTLGPAPKAMQLSQPSLLSYLQRFNQKRRIHYKVDVQPRWQSDAASPRIQAATKVERRTVKESSPAC